MRWNVKDYATQDTFRARIEGLVAAARKKSTSAGPLLVVFPEDVGAPLYFLGAYDAVCTLTSLDAASSAVAKSNLLSVMYKKLIYDVSLNRALGLALGPQVGETYISTFSNAARKYGVYIIAGSAPIPDFALARDGSAITFKAQSPDVYNASYFFGPDGRIIGSQRKVYPIPLEQAGGLDLTSGGLDRLEVFDTPFGDVGIAICADTFHDDVVSALVAKGADILVQPSANPEIWDKDEQENWLKSAWTMAQNYPQLRCVVNPMMNGPLFELPFEGQSSIAVHTTRAPESSGYTDAAVKGGFLAVSRTANAEEILFATVTVPADSH